MSPFQKPKCERCRHPMIKEKALLHRDYDRERIFYRIYNIKIKKKYLRRKLESIYSKF